MAAPLTNWAGNVTFSTDQVSAPTSLEELQTVVALTHRLRPLGTAHSFNRVSDTTGTLVSVAGLPPRFEIDASRSTVTVNAGMRYGDVGALLHHAGYALPNLASLPHISVGGAIATATHGSGTRVGNLATAVTALQLVTADGSLVEIDSTDPDFEGCVVSLGALGVVTAATLTIEPAVELAQWIYTDLPRAALDDGVEEIFASAYSVSVFYDWRSPVARVWRKHRLDEPEHLPPPARWLGATLAERPDPDVGNTFDKLTEQFGVPGPWHLRLPHFRMEFTPSHGEELQTEYLLPLRHAAAAIAAVESLREQVAPLVLVSEFRTVAADDLWMSPSYRRETFACHFTWVLDHPGVTAVLPLIEQALEPYSPRPHWGKLFAMGAERLARRYDRYDEFVALMRRYDPDKKFRNGALDVWFPLAAGG